MFCTKCGTQALAGENFCKNCGNNLQGALVEDAKTVQAPVPSSPRVPSLGKLIVKMWGRCDRKGPSPTPYSWIYDGGTLLVFEKGIALSHGKGGPSPLEMFDGGGLVGGVISMVGAMGDKVSNRLSDYSPSTAESLFDANKLIWCLHSNAELWQVSQKKTFFGVATFEALHLPFRSTVGTLECLFRIDNKQRGIVTDHSLNQYIKTVRRFGENLSKDEAVRTFRNLTDKLTADKLHTN